MKHKKYFALKAGLILAIVVFFIDAVFWWSISAGSFYPGKFIREYIIGGIEVPHEFGVLFLLKLGADFMMTISYGLFAFTWLFISFENWNSKKMKDTLYYSALLFGAWIITPFLSIAIPLMDLEITSIRYMDSQIIIQIVTVLIGYILMIILYSSHKFGRKDPKVILYVFVIGCFQAFAMEFPLWLSGIRPTGIDLLIYEVIILTNQGAPYLYIIYDKIIPLLGKLRKKKKVKSSH